MAAITENLRKLSNGTAIERDTTKLDADYNGIVIDIV